MSALKAKLYKQAIAHLDGEAPLASVDGTYEVKRMGADTVRSGILIATDRRLVFYAKKLTGFELESFPYSNISSFEQGKNMMGNTLSFFASGNKVSIKWIRDAELPKLLEVVRSHTSHKAPVAQPVMVAAAPAPAPVSDPVEQMKKLVELRDMGVLAPDEFDAKRREIIARM